MSVPIPASSRNVHQLLEAVDANELLKRSSVFDLPFTLDQLRILKAIAAEGSFTHAADSLYVSQPSVSLQIRSLERHLNVSLFNRVGRRVQLTEAGHILLGYGDRILALCQEACYAIADLQSLQGGNLIVGASQTIGAYLMPQLIGLFHQKYPGVTVQLQVHSTRQICWSVMHGHTDLGIVEGNVSSGLQEPLEVIPYTEDELALVLPVSHPLAQLETILKEDLYKLRFISTDSQSTTYNMIDQMLVQGNVDTQRLNVAMELGSIEAIKNAVQAGLGAAFVSTSAIQKELQLGVLRQIPIQDVVLKRVVSVIFSSNHYHSKAAEAFCQEILPQFATLETAKALLNRKLVESAS